MELKIIIDNESELESRLDFKVEKIVINNDLISSNLLRLFCAHKLFKNVESNEYFVTNLDYIQVEPLDLSTIRTTRIDYYTIIRNESDISKSKMWRCHNLVFDTLILLTSDDFNLEIYQKFIDDKRIIFPTVKPIDLLFIYIINVVLPNIINSNEVLDLLQSDDMRNICDILFDLSKAKPEQRKGKLLDISSSLVKMYNEYENKLSLQSRFISEYDKIKKTYIEYNQKCKIYSEKVDTHLDINTRISSRYDIYEVFNNFIPSRIIPFMHISDFNKILSEYKVPEEWLEELTETEPNQLVFYILNEEENERNKIKPSAKNYSKCYIKEISLNGSAFELDLTIEIERSKIKDEIDRNNIILKLLSNMDLLTVTNELVITEKVAKGYLLYNLPDNLNYIDIPILRDYFLLDDFINYFLSLEQQYTIERLRGGESLYFYKNFILNSFTNTPVSFDTLYKNFDGKLNLLYDKIGKDSRTKIKFPAEFIKSKSNLPDVLVVKYSRLTFDENIFKRIIDTLLCYMNDADNIQFIKSSYEKCL